MEEKKSKESGKVKETGEVSSWKKIAEKGKEVFSYARTLIKKEAKILDIAEQIEKKVKDMKLKFAFPVNISCNEIAAHYSPQINDETRLNGLVKLDIGLMDKGYICDMAESFDLTDDKKFAKLIDASKIALENAIKTAKAGATLSEIGNAIHHAITSKGFSPIVNLCGHELEKYNLHNGLTIPNYDNKNETKLEENQVIAIEPFATTGVGIVQDGKPSGIYNLIQRKPIRDTLARQILDFIDKEYKTLPFCSRWIINKFGTKAVFSLRLLEQAEILHQYSQLVEKSKQPVSQAEHTILIKKNGCEVLTE